MAILHRKQATLCDNLPFFFSGGEEHECPTFTRLFPEGTEESDDSGERPNIGSGCGL